MSQELYPTQIHKILQGNNYTLFILKAKDTLFSIYSSFEVGEFVQRLLIDKKAPRPHTLDLFSSALSGLEASFFQLILHDYEEAIYYAKLFMQQKHSNAETILEIDARPSDGLALAIMHKFPIFTSETLLSKVSPYIE